MPGVLMIEAMAQLGGIVCLSPPINDQGGGRIFFFTGVDGVRWKTPVTPGDSLVMEMTLLDFDQRLGFATMTGIPCRTQYRNLYVHLFNPSLLSSIY